jgi:flagellar motor protein MotB
MTASRPAGRLALAAVAGLALLGAAGCKTASPCRPPACLAEVPEPAPPPYAASPCLPPPPTASLPAPPPAPFPSAEDERIRIQAQTIQRQQELAAALRKALDESEQKRRDAELAGVSPAPGPRGDDAAQRLADELKVKNLRGAVVLVEANKVSVVIPDCFESGSDRLKPNPDVKTAILVAAGAIVKSPEARVEVVGHTDGRPLQKTVEKWGDNVGLSKARAHSVATALAGSGVPRERLAVEGRGEFEPLVMPEKTAADRAKNRRVEIQITF